MSESTELNQQVIELGTYRGAKLWRNNTGATRRGKSYIRFGYKGSGDVIGCYRGYFISIETKTPRDRESADQLRFIAGIRDRGGFACFVHCVEDVARFFDEIDAKLGDDNTADDGIPF